MRRSVAAFLLFALLSVLVFGPRCRPLFAVEQSATASGPDGRAVELGTVEDVALSPAARVLLSPEASALPRGVALFTVRVRAALRVEGAVLPAEWLRDERQAIRRRCPRRVPPDSPDSPRSHLS